MFTKYFIFMLLSAISKVTRSLIVTLKAALNNGKPPKMNHFDPVEHGLS